jgi:hypothetical protein
MDSGPEYMLELTGRGGVGKTTVARSLSKKYPGVVVRPSPSIFLKMRCMLFASRLAITCAWRKWPSIPDLIRTVVLVADTESRVRWLNKVRRRVVLVDEGMIRTFLNSTVHSATVFAIWKQYAHSVFHGLTRRNQSVVIINLVSDEGVAQERFVQRKKSQNRSASRWSWLLVPKGRRSGEAWSLGRDKDFIETIKAVRRFEVHVAAEASVEEVASKVEEVLNEFL